jgi:uncharacterized protein YgiM (DUF1202 family)
MTATTRTRIPALLSLVFSTLLFSLSFAQAADPESEPLHVTVSKDSVNLRTSPDVHSKAARIRLNKGDVLIVRHSSQQDWYEIQLPFPYKGLFVRQDMVTPDQVKK